MATIGALFVNIGANTSGLTTALRSAERGVERFSDKTLRNIEKINNAKFTKLQGSLMNLKTAFTAGIVGAAASEIIKTGIAFERLDYKMVAAVGGLREAAGEMAFVRAESGRLGLRLRDAADMFGTIAASAKGTVIQGQTVRDIFTSVAEAGTVLRLSSEDVKGALYAISQMISKGKVSMEELRQQLGERLPGALLISQRAMKMTGQEFDALVSKGTLLAEDFLPKLANELQHTFAEALPEAVKSTQSELNRFLTDWDDAVNTVAKGGMIQGFRWLLKIGVATFKGINWAVTSFVATSLRLFEYLKMAVAQVWITIEHSYKNTWRGIVGLFSGGLRKIADGVDWINQLLNGIGASSSTGGLRKFADEMDLGSKTGANALEKNYADAIKETQKNFADATKGIEEIQLKRWNALFGEPPPVPDAIAPGDQSGKGGLTTAQKKHLSDLERLRKKLALDVQGEGLTGFAKQFEIINYKAQDWLKTFPELTDEINAWKNEMLSRNWAKDQVEQWALYTKAVKKAAKDAAAIAEGDIENNLFDLDLEEAKRTKGRGDLVTDRLANYSQLLDVQKDYLDTLDKENDPASWYSQMDAINATRQAIVELGTEYDRVFGGMGKGAKDAAFDFFEGFKTAYEHIYDLTTETAELMYGTFSDGFFDLMDGQFSSISDMAKDMADDFGDIFNRMLADMVTEWLATQAKLAMANLFTGGAGGLGSMLQQGGSLLAGLFSTPNAGGGGEGILGATPAGNTWSPQGRAAGGPVFADTAYTVGERGPETFVPNIAGRIVPSGGGGYQAENHYHGVTTDAFIQDMEESQRRVAEEVIERHS